MKDLVCLVADKNIESAMAGLLARPRALGIRTLLYEIMVHPRRDPGVFHEGVSFLRALQGQYEHALLFLDTGWEGAPQNIQSELQENLARAGLETWARVIVIEPEIEVWVWSDSPHVEETLGWYGRTPRLREWLEQKGLWSASLPKPEDPKTALESVLYEVRRPRSSAIYRALAGKTSFERCQDGAFLRLRQTLREWFPYEDA